MVTVEYVAHFTDLAGKRREEIGIARNGTVGDLIDVLCAKYGQRFRKAVYDRMGELICLLFVNNEISGVDRILCERDRVIFSVLVAGG